MSITYSASFPVISGTGPLFGFADYTGTTSTATSSPLDDLEYYTDWGDSAVSGIWTYGRAAGLSRSISYGPIAAHVFETPGVWPVATYVYDGATLSGPNIQSITVNDPNVVYSGTNTVCYSNAGLSSGGPAGCAYATSSSESTVVAACASNKRVLMHCTDTFSETGQVNFPAGISNWTLGSWGTGAAPIVSNSVATSFAAALSINTATNGRIMNLHFIGSAAPDVYGILLSNSSGNSRIVVIRCETEAQSFTFNLSGSTTPDQFCVFECHLHDIGPATVGYGGIFEFTKFALLGNWVENLHPTNGATNVAHCYRIGKGQKGVVQHNTLQDNYGGSLIKCHAANSSTDSFHIVFSDNKLISSANSSNSIDFGPEIPAINELVRDSIFERNWVIYGSGMGNPLVLESTQRITVRNNLFDGSLATLATKLMRLFTNSAMSGPTDNRVYNNTFYTSDTGSMNIILNDTGAVNTVIKNNIGYAPNMTTPAMISDAGSGTIAANNSSNAQVKTPNPFVSGSPSVPADFKLSSGSYAKGTGVAVAQIFEDYFDHWRTGTMDMGAFAFDETGVPPWGGGAPPTVRGAMAMHADNIF